jgi:molybdopterin biosynthesis enzyme MoaB
MIRVAVLTISDSSPKGTRADESGELLKELVVCPALSSVVDIVVDEVE